ncbi:MAG: class I SAM-dependent methyltransferase [Planctomycetota bacterium]
MGMRPTDPDRGGGEAGRSSAPFVVARVGAEGDPSSFLELRREGDREGRGVRCDLGAISLRGGRAEARAMPVAKAVGDARTVVDATAGLLGDAFLLAAAGFEVTAIERSPLVHAVVRDGLERALRDPRLAALIGGRLRLVHADARAWLEAAAGTPDAPDAVLIDPMFPPKKKRSALPRKEMVVLREAVGTDEDAGGLLTAARRCARMRVALKRADDAAELATPDWRTEGKTVRFDVWRAENA